MSGCTRQKIYSLTEKKSILKSDIENIAYFDEVIFHFLRAVNKNHKKLKNDENIIFQKKFHHFKNITTKLKEAKLSFPLMYKIQNQLLKSSEGNHKTQIQAI